MKKLLLAAGLFLSATAGLAVEENPQQVSAMGYFESADSDFMDFKLLDFTRHISLYIKFAESPKAYLSQVFLSADEYWRVFEAPIGDDANKVELNSSGFKTILRADYVDSPDVNRVVSIQQSWTDDLDNVTTTDHKFELRVYNSGAISVYAKIRSLKAIQIGPFEIPTVWTTDFETKEAVDFNKLKTGLSLYGSNSSDYIGRILTLDGIKKALAGDPESTYRSVTREHLVSTCEVDCN